MIRPIEPRHWSWALRWILVPVIAAGLLAALVDPTRPPVLAQERVTAVLLLDGQAYFGRLSDSPFSDHIQLRDVYYFQDARDTSMNVPLGLVRRGGEAHRPVDGMIIRRDKIVAIETVGPGSQVALAMSVDRHLRSATIR